MSKLGRVITAAEQGHMMTLRSNAVIPLADEAAPRAAAQLPSDAMSRRNVMLNVSSRPDATFIISPQGDAVPLNRAIGERPDLFLGPNSQADTLPFELAFVSTGYLDVDTWKDVICTIGHGSPEGESLCSKSVLSDIVENVCQADVSHNHEQFFSAVERSLILIENLREERSLCRDLYDVSIATINEIMRRGGQAVRAQYPISGNELAPTIVAICNAIEGAGYYHGFKGPLGMPLMRANQSNDSSRGPMTFLEAVRGDKMSLRSLIHFFSLRPGDVRRVLSGEPFGLSADVDAFTVSPYPRQDVFLYDWHRDRSFSDLMNRSAAKKHKVEINRGGVVKRSESAVYQVHNVREGREFVTGLVDERMPTHEVRRFVFDGKREAEFDFSLGRNPLYVASWGGWSLLNASGGSSARLQGGEVRFVPWNGNSQMSFASSGAARSMLVAVSPK